MPAYVGDRYNVAGIKWIASFPMNITRNLNRASAVLILNDYETGYPFACLESSLISASRTAASAVLATEYLSEGRKKEIQNLGVVGTGVIANNVLRCFVERWCKVENILLYDIKRANAEEFQQEIEFFTGDINVEVLDSFPELVQRSSVISLTTTAGTPYFDDFSLLSHNPIVLNISLRDIAPNIILKSFNILDDIEHCLKANTSPHLAEQQVQNREFINGNLGHLMDGQLELPSDQPKIFSPFGLGILDLALGKHFFEVAHESGDLIEIPNFFPTPNNKELSA